MRSYSKVLVTGGAGFIGSHLVDRMLTENLEVVVLDNLYGGRLENIKQHIGEKSFRFVKGDIRDSRTVRNLIKGVDAVIHQAALVSVPESIKNPILTNEVNVDGTLNLLKVSADSNVKRFVYASTCAVYGDAETLPIQEGCSLKPTSPYGISKLSAENYVKIFYEVFGIETVSLRYFNVYGPRQIHNHYSGVIKQFIDCITRNRSLTIFGNGEQNRDFVHVQDVVEANMLALRKTGIAGDVFNIATGTPTTINQLANMLLEITKKTCLKIVHSEPRKGDIKISYADISKARNRLQYAPKTSLKEGLKAIAKNYGLLK
jgi:UDP-glucose 4-epimerase